MAEFHTSFNCIVKNKPTAWLTVAIPSLSAKYDSDIYIIDDGTYEDLLVADFNTNDKAIYRYMLSDWTRRAITSVEMLRIALDAHAPIQRLGVISYTYSYQYSSRYALGRLDPSNGGVQYDSSSIGSYGKKEDAPNNKWIIDPNQYTRNSNGYCFIALPQNKEWKGKNYGLTIHTPFAWFNVENTSVSLYHYTWAVDGAANKCYTAFDFDHSTDRLYGVIATQGDDDVDHTDWSLAVVELDYSGVTTDLDNARGNDFLSVVNTFYTDYGGYVDRIYFANGLLAWVVKKSQVSESLFIANVSSGNVQVLKTVLFPDRAKFGGFDYDSSLGRWCVLFGIYAFISDDGSNWTECKIIREGTTNTAAAMGYNLVIHNSKVYCNTNAGIGYFDLASM